LTTTRALPPLCARISAVLIFTALLVACGSGAKPPALHLAGSPRLHFAYDAALPLQYVDHGRVAGHPGPIAVHDVSFRSDGATIDGYLVLPPSRARRPAVVVVHGSGGDRRELLTEAEWLAARNVVVLTITEPSTSNPPAPASAGPAAILGQLRDTQVRDVIAIRRAVDALRSLRVVDPGRIGYLGWSAGAKTGAFVAASEPRVKALVLLSAGADPVSAFVAHAPPALRAVVRRDLGSVDPIRYIAAARPGSVLLEDGTRDEIVPHAALLNVIHAAPKGTTVRWYAAPHALNRAAYHDAFDWLARKLPIDGPRVSGAATESTRGG
jgi:dienelactone hydrolase